MIDYDTEQWLVRLTCRWKGSVMPSALLIAVPSSLLGVVLVYLREEFEEFADHSEFPDFPSTAWTVLVLPLSMLISFRTATAFRRFWEGTSLLHSMRGEWFDSASCLATFSLPAKSKKPKEVSDFRHTLMRLMSLCHGSALDELKATQTENYEVLDLWGLGDDTMSILRECKNQEFNRVEVILHMIQVLVINAQQTGIIDIPPPILSRVYQTLSRGLVNLLSAKKIKDTRFPFPYAQLLSVFLLVVALWTPFVMSTMLETKALCFVFTFIPVFALLCLNYTAGQLEMPFGDDDNDLPLDKFQQEMNTSLLMLLHECSDHVARPRSTCMKDFGAIKSTLHEDSINAHLVGPRKARRSTSGSTKSCRQSMFVREPLPPTNVLKDGVEDKLEDTGSDGRCSFGLQTSTCKTQAAPQDQMQQPQQPSLQPQQPLQPQSQQQPQQPRQVLEEKKSTLQQVQLQPPEHLVQEHGRQPQLPFPGMLMSAQAPSQLQLSEVEASAAQAVGPRPPRGPGAEAAARGGQAGRGGTGGGRRLSSPPFGGGDRTQTADSTPSTGQSWDPPTGRSAWTRFNFQNAQPARPDSTFGRKESRSTAALQDCLPWNTFSGCTCPTQDSARD